MGVISQNNKSGFIVSLFMVDAQTSFLLYTVGLTIEILGAWSAYASLPRWDEGLVDGFAGLYMRVRRGFRNLGLFLTLGFLMQFIAGL